MTESRTRPRSSLPAKHTLKRGTTLRRRRSQRRLVIVLVAALAMSILVGLPTTPARALTLATSSCGTHGTTPSTGTALLNLAMDEGTGTTAADTSGRNHTGNLAGAARWAGVGPNDNTVDTGGNGWVSVPDAADLHASDNLSVFAWICERTVGPGDGRIVDTGVAGGGYGGFDLDTYGSGSGHAMRFDNLTGSNFSFNTWHRVGVVVQGGIGQLYVDGVADPASNARGATTFTPGLRPLFIGAGQVLGGGQTAQFDGLIDDVQMSLLPPATTCADVLAALPGAPDGEYQLTLHTQLVSIYCAGMASGTPKEYLTLPNTGAGENFARYQAGGARGGSDVISSFTRVRVRVPSLRIEMTDRTFSTDNGGYNFVLRASSIAYAIAGDCDNTTGGSANVDLRLTPFAVLGGAGAFVTQGSPPRGTTTQVGATNQDFNLSGGGYCGWNSPAPTGPQSAGPVPATYPSQYSEPVTKYLQLTLAGATDVPGVVTPAAVAATEGVPFTGRIATFTASGGSTAANYSVQIGWDDGTYTAGTVTGPTGGPFTVSGGGTHTYPEESGSRGITLLITGGGGAVTGATSTTVADGALTASGVPITTTEGTAFTGAVATLTDQDPLAAPGDFSATISWGDGQTSPAAFSGPTGGPFTLTGSHTYAEEGSKAASLTLTDVGGAVAAASSTATVADAPLTPAGVAVTAGEGQPFSGRVATFTDADPGAVSTDFTAAITWGDGRSGAGTVTGPAGGPFSVTGSNTYAQEGSYTIAVTITDAGGAVARPGTTATIGDAPLSPTGAAVSATEGQPFSGRVATFTDANPGAPSTDFTAAIAWGDGQTSPGTVTGPAGGPFTVTGSNTYANEGSNTVGVTITDIGGATASAGSTATVIDAPLTSAGAAVSATEGQPFSGTVATFTDANPGSPSTDFTASITWGDGHTSAGTVTGPSAGRFTVAGTDTYVDEATSRAVQVTIADVGGSSSVATTSAAITDATLTATTIGVSATEGGPFSGMVATFTDANPGAPLSDFTASIVWGDGHVSSGTVAGPTGGPFSVTGSNTYADEGSRSVSVTITDVGGAVASATGAATVADAALTAAGAAVSSAEGQAFSGTVATFTDANPAAPSTDFSASITWGDGRTSTGTVAGSTGGPFVVTGSNTYIQEGSYAVSVTITDVGGATAGAGSTATIGDAVLNAAGVTVGVVEGQVFTGTVATVTDANPAAPSTDLSALIVWGDGHTSAGTVTGPNGGPFTVAGSNTYADEGSYAVAATITDAGGSVARAGSTATVTDGSLGATGSNLGASEGQAFPATVATFTDTNPASTAIDFAATIAWGDGSSSAGAIAGPTGGPFAVTSAHSYAEEGGYPLDITITDDGGATVHAASTAGVGDAPLTAVVGSIAATEGSATTVTVATLNDADPGASSSDFTATITWGDGHTSSGSVTGNQGGPFTVSGTNTYVEEGNNTLSVTVTDAGGSTTAAAGSATVGDASLTAAGVNVAVPGEGRSFTATVATFTDANPAATPADFTAPILWGDGLSSAGTVSGAVGGPFTVTGTHTYATPGTKAISVTINDTGGSSARTGSTATVGDAALSGAAANVTAVEGKAFSGTVATFTDADPAATAAMFAATVDWGDGHAGPGTVTGSAGGPFTISGNHTYAHNGSDTVKVTVTDAGGSKATIGGTATVADAPLGGSGMAVSGRAGTPFTTTLATTTDVNPSGSPSDLRAAINWGDATSSAGTVGGATGGPFPISAGHTYSRAGVYTIAVTVRDIGGSLAAATSTAMISAAPAPPAPASPPGPKPGSGPRATLSGPGAGPGSPGSPGSPGAGPGGQGGPGTTPPGSGPDSSPGTPSAAASPTSGSSPAGDSSPGSGNGMGAPGSGGGPGGMGGSGPYSATDPNAPSSPGLASGASGSDPTRAAGQRTTAGAASLALQMASVFGTGRAPRPGAAFHLRAANLPTSCHTVYFFFDHTRIGSAHPDRNGVVDKGGLQIPGDANAGSHTLSTSCSSSGRQMLESTPVIVPKTALHVSGLVTSLPTPGQIDLSPKALGGSAGISLILVLLIAFSCELFNVVFEENYDEIRGWFPSRKSSESAVGEEDDAGPSRLRRNVTFAAFISAGGVLFAMLDPRFGLNATSVTLSVGLAISLFVIVLVWTAPLIIYMRVKHGDWGALETVPGSLAVGALLVALSRFLHFEPGYLFGVLAGLAYRQELAEELEGRFSALCSLSMTAVALLAWVAWVPVAAAAGRGSPGVALIIADTVLATVFACGLESAVFALIPLKFMEGKAILSWNKVAWAAIFGIGVFLFVHVLLKPSSGYVSGGAPSMTNVLIATIALVVASVGFWLFFKLREEADSGENDGAPTADPGHERKGDYILAGKGGIHHRREAPAVSPPASA